MAVKRIDQYADLGAAWPTDAVLLCEVNPANVATRDYRKSTGGNLFAGINLRRASNQSVNSGTGTNILFDTTDYTDANVFSFAAGVLTILQAGKYLFNAGAVFDANVTGVRSIALFSSGPTLFWALDRRNATSSSSVGLQISRVLDVAPNTLFAVSAFQTSGAALNLLATNRDIYFSVHRIAP